MTREGALEGARAIFAGHRDIIHFTTGRITVDEGVICAWSDLFSIHTTFGFYEKVLPAGARRLTAAALLWLEKNGTEFAHILGSKAWVEAAYNRLSTG